jgi:hypothetical protein
LNTQLNASTALPGFPARRTAAARSTGARGQPCHHVGLDHEQDHEAALNKVDYSLEQDHDVVEQPFGAV